jgi:hypothetical protein
MYGDSSGYLVTGLEADAMRREGEAQMKERQAEKRMRGREKRLLELGAYEQEVADLVVKAMLWSACPYVRGHWDLDDVMDRGRFYVMETTREIGLEVRGKSFSRGVGSSEEYAFRVVDERIKKGATYADVEAWMDKYGARLAY